MSCISPGLPSGDEALTSDPVRKESAPGAGWRDNYLCYCEEIAADDFSAAVAAAPEQTFEQICASTGLASKCTACLLNAENLFIQVGRSSTGRAAATGARKRRADQPRGRQRLYHLVDSVSPKIARKVPGIIPVIGGDGVSTMLAFANTVPPLIGDRAPAFDVELTVLDAEGRQVAQERAQVLPDSRIEFDVSANLPPRDGGLVTGSCFLRYRAAAQGFIGSIRPHFKVVTAIAASSVHSAGAGRREAYVESCLMNPAERQFVSAVNCTSATARVSMTVRGGDKVYEDGPVSIPPRGARLLPLPAGTPQGEMFAVAATADREVRWHYLLSAGDPPMISLDHI